MRWFIVLALAALAFVAVSSASAVTDFPADCDQICQNKWYANQTYASLPPDTGDTLEKGWTSTTRCYNNKRYAGRGILHEARRYSLYVRWCVRNNSQITSWGYGLENTTGAQCHLGSYDTPYIYQGALNTSAIYVSSRAHFACDVGFIWPATVTVHPDCWIKVRYGALGGSALQTKGCDWV